MAGLFASGGTGTGASSNFTVPGDVSWPGTDRLADIQERSGTAAPQVPKAKIARASPAPGPDIGARSLATAKKPASDVSNYHWGKDVNTGEMITLTNDEWKKIMSSKATPEELQAIDERSNAAREAVELDKKNITKNINRDAGNVNKNIDRAIRKPIAATQDIEDFVLGTMR